MRSAFKDLFWNLFVHVKLTIKMNWPFKGRMVGGNELIALLNFICKLKEWIADFIC
jgi:hypothetical protein